MVTAYVLVLCETGSEFKIQKELLCILEIIESTVTYGLYDIVCKIEAPSIDNQRYSHKWYSSNFSNKRNTDITTISKMKSNKDFMKNK